MPHDGRVKGDLPKFAARVRVGLKKDVRVRFDEHPQGQLTRAQQNLGGGLVLTVEDLQHSRPVALRRPPRQGDVELRPLLQKLLNESPDVRTDAAWVNAVVVVQVLERERREERAHAAQFVFEHGYSANRVVTGLRQTELHDIPLCP